MRSIVESEFQSVQPVPPGESINYDSNNPLIRVIREVEAIRLAGTGECYLADSVQYLFPVRDLALYGPMGDQWQVRRIRPDGAISDVEHCSARS